MQLQINNSDRGKFQSVMPPVGDNIKRNKAEEEEKHQRS